MKKILLLIATVLLCLSITSCKEEAINNAESFDDTHSLENNVNIEGLESNNNINQDENYDVPYSASFSSITEMQDFLNSAKGNAVQYEEFIRGNNVDISVPQIRAQTMAANVEQNDIPLIKSNWVADGFGATYYFDRNELDIIYRINGIRHRFVYRYNETSGSTRTTAPILEGLKLGTYTVDLYQGDECFVGEIVTNSAVIQVVVYTEQANDVALNAFSLGSLSNNVDK